MSVGGLLLALGLQLHRAADGLDDDVLGVEVGHVDEDLVRVVVVLDAGDAVPAPVAAADRPDRPAEGRQRGRVGEEAAGVAAGGRVEEGRGLEGGGGVVLPAEEGGAEAAAAVGAADEAVALARLLGCCWWCSFSDVGFVATQHTT